MVGGKNYVLRGAERLCFANQNHPSLKQPSKRGEWRQQVPRQSGGVGPSGSPANQLRGCGHGRRDRVRGGQGVGRQLSSRPLRYQQAFLF